MKTQVCIRLPDELKKRIEIRAKRSHRNFSNQLEDYLRIALIRQFRRLKVFTKKHNYSVGSQKWDTDTIEFQISIFVFYYTVITGLHILTIPFPILFV